MQINVGKNSDLEQGVKHPQRRPRKLGTLRCAWLALPLMCSGGLGCQRTEQRGDDAAREILTRHMDAERITTNKGDAPQLAAVLEQIRDPWTRVLSPEESKSLLDDISYSTAFGVGLPELLLIDLDVFGHKPQVVSPLPLSSAERAG